VFFPNPYRSRLAPPISFADPTNPRDPSWPHHHRGRHRISCVINCQKHARVPSPASHAQLRRPAAASWSALHESCSLAFPTPPRPVAGSRLSVDPRPRGPRDGTPGHGGVVDAASERAGRVPRNGMAELTNRPRFCVPSAALRIGHSLTHSPRFAARALSVRCTVASRVCKRSTRRDSDPAPSARVFFSFPFFFCRPRTPLLVCERAFTSTDRRRRRLVRPFNFGIEWWMSERERRSGPALDP
jgi:hypothetical protein